MDAPRPPALRPSPAPPASPPVTPPLPPVAAQAPPLPSGVPPLPPAPRRCLNCDAEVSGPFCSACGQEHAPAGGLTARVTFRDLADSGVRVNLDFFRSVGVLVSKPGRLTNEFLAGRRARRVSPARLYLVVNFIVFLLAQWVDPETAERVGESTGVAALEAAARARGVSVEHFSRDLEGRLASLLPSGFFLLVPAFALALGVLHLGTKRSFATHTVFAFHYTALMLVAMVPSMLLSATTLGETAMGAALLVALPLWLVIAMRRVYGAGWPATIGRALVASLVFILLIVIYYEIVARWALATA